MNFYKEQLGHFLSAHSEKQKSNIRTMIEKDTSIDIKSWLWASIPAAMMLNLTTYILPTILLISSSAMMVTAIGGLLLGAGALIYGTYKFARKKLSNNLFEEALCRDREQRRNIEQKIENYVESLYEYLPNVVPISVVDDEKRPEPVRFVRKHESNTTQITSIKRKDSVINNVATGEILFRRNVQQKA